MENQKPFKLKKTLIAYNLLQAVLSFYLFFEEGRISWLGRYSWRCQPIDFSQNEFAMRVSVNILHDYC